MAKYLVTGGAGFIGSHLADHLLAEGNDVVILDDLSNGKASNVPAKAKFIIGDVRDTNVVRDAMSGAQGCFHLAAIASVAASNDNWILAHQTNQTATINIFEAARDAGKIPVVYASSAAVYGDTSVVPLREDSPKQPLTAYGADKLGSELHAIPALHVHGVPSTGLRFFNVYGPRQDPASQYSGVISIFSNRMAKGQSIVIHGTGEQTRDFIYVSDVCEALSAAMKTSTTGARVFNVCTKRETSVKQLAETLASILEYSQDYTFAPNRIGDIVRSFGDNSHLVRDLGITPKVSLEDGLRALASSMVTREQV